MEFHQFSYQSDNYGVLVHDAASGETACVDAGDAEAALGALEERGWRLTQLWITHHHGDHIAGLAEIKARTGARVYGPGASQIVGLDETLADGDGFTFAGQRVEVLHTPGHTMDMLNYYLPETGVVFTGDTLFVMGCGRLFEGSAEVMWGSLQKLMALPPETRVYCGHEYTQANAAFALTVDGGNARLRERAEAVRALRAEGRPTVPSTIGEELATNPFLRAGDTAVRQGLGMEGASDAAVFGEIRRRKDAG